ncbi:hypothetical protein K431DRAFT_319981 [Polychaeton citri CBS 116435]|uniref:Amino acid transporter transmembrane domain-containing protein n=1 Tax=Polychaeton citri CBS 116435 TaxID=1314669 RepID=A0A9P4Q963_9PEZI|nr:hypothetical protein K431DRAFT_319981 [Polychaeton citri CBS 116435]
MSVSEAFNTARGGSIASGRPSIKEKHSDSDIPVGTDFGEAHAKFHRLGWKKLTICLIVEAIALGSLSMPSVFATVGMVAGTLMSVGIGFIAIYTSYLIGELKMRYPHIAHYSDAVQLIWGKFGYELTGVMFALFLILIVGSHTLTGTIAWVRIIEDDSVCALVWSIISAILLFLVALPPTFAEFAILGYIDFASIICAIGITIISTGIRAHQAPGGLSGVDWHVWPPPGVSFYEGFLSTTNIIFAYGFAVCQFSFMDEMHTPKDYIKSIWALGIIEILIYTLTGALIYAFVGTNVASPALLSAGPTVSRVAFGVALPVIFISGSINGTVAGRYIIARMFPNSQIKYINTKQGWMVWIVLIAAITIIGWVIAEAIPFFSALLGIISSLFISAFSFSFPALFYFHILSDGNWFRGWKAISLSLINFGVLIFGIAVLGCGTYASVQDIVNGYKDGTVRGSFSCDATSYE